MRILATQTIEKVGETVLLKGWINNRRNMGKIVFLDFRDISGLLQIVAVPQELDDDSNKILMELRSEFVIEVAGVVNQRGPKQVNENLTTGTVEVLAKSIKILNTCKELPFEVNKDTSDVNEELRLKHRYLDLRSERVKNNMLIRNKYQRFIYNYFQDHGFTYVDTPLLTKGTPEGSREFLVPSRLHKGKFYVLPQSPQQYKQMLVMGGIEKYFQFAPSFRDEDPRADRSPGEFWEIDAEMAFVTQQDIREYIEGFIKAMVKEVFPDKTLTSQEFPQMTYQESMEKYKNDKPDLRNDVSDPNELAFCWVTDFPMFEQDENGLAAKHHPFTNMHEDDLKLLDNKPLEIRAQAFDLVLNGYEMGSCSIRIHTTDLQEKVFQVLGMDKEKYEKLFGHVLQALSFGAPPHGGFGLGFDRMLMVILGEKNIREVFAFPKLGDGKDLTVGAPSEMPVDVLLEAGVKVVK